VYGPLNQIFFTSKNPNLEVSVKTNTSYGVRLYLKPTSRTEPVIVQARLGSATGPVLAEQKIDAFDIDYSPITHIVVNGATGIANTYMTMKPWVPNLDVNYAMFASFSTFADGSIAYKVNTSDFTTKNVNGDPAVELVVDPSTGETQAILRVDFGIPPEESGYCFRATFDQHSKYGTEVQCTTVNGKVCKWTLYEAYWEEDVVDGQEERKVKAKCTEGHDKQHNVWIEEAGFSVSDVLLNSTSQGKALTCTKGNEYMIKVKKDQRKDVNRYKLLIDPATTATVGSPAVPFQVLVVAKVEIDPCDEKWDPVKKGAKDDTTDITARVKDNDVIGKFKFTLPKEEVSDEPGYCMNAPIADSQEGENADDWEDLQFKAGQTDFTISSSAGATAQDTAETTADTWNEKSVTVQSFDYGAYGKIHVEFTVTSEAGETTTIKGKLKDGTAEFATIPRDELNGNHIRDNSEWDVGPGATYEASDDEEKDPESRQTGDGFTRYAEWRGFMVNGQFKRLDVKKRELFVYDPDALGLGYYSSGSGIVVHKILNTEWTGTGNKADKKRIMNCNQETAATDPRYGLHLVNGGGEQWSDRVGRAHGDPNNQALVNAQAAGWASQADCLYVEVLRNTLELRFPAKKQEMIDRTIAHEMGHATGLTHHNPLDQGDPCPMREPTSDTNIGTKFCISVDRCIKKFRLKQ